MPSSTPTLTPTVASSTPSATPLVIATPTITAIPAVVLTLSTVLTETQILATVQADGWNIGADTAPVLIGLAAISIGFALLKLVKLLTIWRRND